MHMCVCEREREKEEKKKQNDNTTISEHVFFFSSNISMIKQVFSDHLQGIKRIFNL